MTPAAGAHHASERTPIRAAVPDGFASDVHPFSFVAGLAEIAALMANRALLRAPFSLQRMSKPEVEVVHPLQHQAFGTTG